MKSKYLNEENFFYMEDETENSIGENDHHGDGDINTDDEVEELYFDDRY